MLSCRQMVELLSDYLDGSLPISRRLSLRLHRLMCAPCDCYHEQMVAMLDAARALPAEQLPPDFAEMSEAVLQAVRAADATS